MYRAFLYILVLSVLAFVIWASFFWIQLKITLSLVVLTVLPFIRKKLYSDEALFRKGKAALYASVFLTACGLLMIMGSMLLDKGMDFAALLLTIFYFIAFLFGSVVYGIPVSSFSDLVTAQTTRYRLPLAFLIHLGFGLLSYLFLGPLMYFAVIVAVVFFVFDEILRKKASV